MSDDEFEKTLPTELREYIAAKCKVAEALGYARAKAEAALASSRVKIVAKPGPHNGERPTETDKRMERLSQPNYKIPVPRGRNAEIVEEILKSLAPNGATATALQHAALHQKKTRIAGSSMRHALDQLEAKGVVSRMGDEWFYSQSRNAQSC
jgi:hypothetical protein